MFNNVKSLCKDSKKIYIYKLSNVEQWCGNVKNIVTKDKFYHKRAIEWILIHSIIKIINMSIKKCEKKNNIVLTVIK